MRDAGSKRHSVHVVELSQRSGKPCANCVDRSRPQPWQPYYRFGASRPCGPAGWLAMLLINAGDVDTNPGPTTTRTQVWICDICHIQIQVRKQISIRSHSHPNILSAYTHAIQTTVHASQSPQQSHPQHMVSQQLHRQTKDYKHHKDPAVKVR